MEIAGLIVSFLGAVILAFITYANSFIVWRQGSMKDKLKSPKAAIAGLAIMPIGFGLQFVASLLP